jgi:uncharacterized coiled-coil protein SlyX
LLERKSLDFLSSFQKLHGVWYEKTSVSARYVFYSFGFEFLPNNASNLKPNVGLGGLEHQHLGKLRGVMKLELKSLVVGVVLTALVIGIAKAATTVPNTFTAGTTISASQMNANFAALTEQISALETSRAAQSDLIALRDFVVLLQRDQTALADRIAQLETRVGRGESRTTALEGRVTALERQIAPSGMR